jgi:hypothetical protein
MRTLPKTLLLLAVLSASAAFAQQETLEVSFDLAQYSHPGSWSFSQGCTHTPPTGRTNYVHITVVWLEDANGNYVTTLHRWGRSYLYNLKAWAQADDKGIDGVTSATPTSQAMAPAQVFKTFTTGARPISSLPDGTYRVRFESTQCELADDYRVTPNPNPYAGGTPFGPTATFMFTKGRTSQTGQVLGSTAPFNNVRVNYVVPAGNAPPGVYAGPDQRRRPSVTPAEATTTLTGVVSDPAGTPTVQWTQVSSRPNGLTASIATPTAATTNVTFTQAGIYTFRLTATDSGGLSSSDDVTVFVNTTWIASAGDAEVNSNNPTLAMGIIDNSGPWTWAWGPDTGNRSRAYFRFDVSTLSAPPTWASIQLWPAEQVPNTALNHDFYILTDAQDDWNGPANASTDYEATITWNNQPVAQGLATNLPANQLAGSMAHLACLFRHSYADPDANPGEPATVCPSTMEVPLNLNNVRMHDANRIWSFFMAPRPVGMNGLGAGSDENDITTRLLVVEAWPSQPSLTVTMSTSAALENVGTVMNAGTVSIPTGAAAPVAVTLAADLSAQLDFVANPVTIPMGQTSVPFSLTLVDDPPGVSNASRFATLTANASGYNPGSAQFEILDNEAGVYVGFDKAAEAVAEAASPSVQLRATLSAAATVNVVVPFTVTGTAARGTDFTTPVMANQLTIPAGSTSAAWVINVLNDTEVEGDETVVVTMGTPTGATEGGNRVYTLTITDDDGAGMADGGTGPGTTGSCGCSSAEAGVAWLALLLLGFARRRAAR